MDKQKGSFALIKQFMSMNANGIIATHDLLLGTLIEAFPENIRNYCFEADITNNELTFSYQKWGLPLLTTNPHPTTYKNQSFLFMRLLTQISVPIP